MTLESKYKGQIMSKTGNVNNITSKTAFGINSNAADIISMAKNAQGANDIAAMVGAFSKCTITE